MLVDPPIAIVGLSNWVLDPAKMNRAVLVQRPEPSNQDIALTGIFFLTRSSFLSAFLNSTQKIFFFRTFKKGASILGLEINKDEKKPVESKGKAPAKPANKPYSSILHKNSPLMSVLKRISRAFFVAYTSQKVVLFVKGCSCCDN